MEQFTEAFFIEFVSNELAKQYYRYPKVQGMYELDDLVQDVIMWYYQPMRNGEQRLAHYLKLYDLQHFCNHLRFSLQQYIPALLRYNHMKYIPMSLNVPLDYDNESTEFIDMIADETESYESKLTFIDTFDEIKRALKESNTRKLYKEAKRLDPNLCYDEFKVYPTTITEIGPILRDQLNIISDLLHGYKPSELRNKYTNYDSLLRCVKSAVEQFYLAQGTDVNSILGRQSKKAS